MYRSKLFQGIEQPGPRESLLWLVYFALGAVVVLIALVTLVWPDAGHALQQALLFPLRVIFDS